MTLKERYQYVLDYFEKENPEPETELIYDSPYQLLVAVILSAQCTDERVNQTTPRLFEEFPEPKDLAEATVEEVFNVIRSITFPNNKSKQLVNMGKMLVEDFNSEVPLVYSDLIKLPGVGRKTANVVTSILDNQPAMAVDTHVFRVSNRIGLTRAKNVLESEKQLIRHIPKELVHKAHHWIILHGRYICKARRPLCEACGITKACRYFAKNFPEQE
ncbi:MAG TPA: endonuclease III [Chitinophagaceae bacterium]|nr:endonuclease III [Chitinophagaceae bacterium]